ncbi:formate dehydrogenase subunit alpha [Sapientia aquatica]|uniref:Formate dehydrogenase subunit alpha n=1 Tax=Sapientia aquatica TaxID=1549640 RepID=A0A4R5W5V6_9BURK|nr:formate dehydrogenase subunit alpha [Sapientia aquatica]TDK68448.1 formate dehydrogenase subunit alpha [Sapientia aquatica]
MNQLNQTDYGTPARQSENLVTIEIDGVEVQVAAGTSVMRAAVEAGVNVPKLCATDSLEPFGSCRLCLVEIEGRRGYPASCTTPCEPGMKVKTQSPKLASLRKGVMELYISDHPLDCLTCPTNGNCELQDMAGVVGLREVRYGYEGKNHLELKKDESNPYFTYDASKCIVCNRCVRACEETQGTFALTISGRGFESRVSPGQSQPFMESECVSCGACVDACPTATLTEKTIIMMGQAEHSKITTCAYCGVGCSFKAEMKGNEVVRMVPNKDGHANHGHSCVKGRFAWGYATHKDRMLKPMIRKNITDPWKEVSWDEALNYAASEFRRIQAKFGKDSIGGITSSRCTNEETYLVQKLVRAAFGNNNVDTCARVCHSPTGFGLKQTLGESAGTQTFDSVMKSDVIMIIGANPAAAHPVFASQMKRRLRQGAKLIVIDPRTTEMVKSPHIQADYHLKLKPGTNVAVITALAHVIMSEKLFDADYIAQRCDTESFEHWTKFVLKPENSPEAMEPITGVSAEELRGAARMYAQGNNGAIYYGLGVTEHAQGSTMVIGIANLAMATGNVGREGVGVNPLRGQNNVQGSCDMGSFPHELPGYRHISDTTIRTQFERAWDCTLNPEPGLRIPNMFDAALSGSFKGLYCEGEDIVQSDPNTQHVTAALSAMECIVVQDIFLNETAKYAHVFLPGSSFLEKDGTFTNAERRISRVRKVMPPKAGKSDWEVTVALSNALGYPMNYKHPSEIMDEIAALTPTFKGVSYKRLEELGSIQWPCNDAAPNGTPTMHIDQFVRGKGKFINTQFFATSEKVTPKFPLILTTGRILSQYNVGAQTRRTENVHWHNEDLLEIHPHDAEDRGIKTNTLVGIESRAGHTVLRALVTERMQPGVVYTTFHFPESGANVITTDNSDWATNCPEYKVTAVQVMPVLQQSEWQQKYSQFHEQQMGLLKENAEEAGIK